MRFAASTAKPIAKTMITIISAMIIHVSVVNPAIVPVEVAVGVGVADDPGLPTGVNTG